MKLWEELLCRPGAELEGGPRVGDMVPSEPSSKRVVIDSILSITNQFEVLAEPSIAFKISLTFLAEPSNVHPKTPKCSSGHCYGSNTPPVANCMTVPSTK